MWLLATCLFPRRPVSYIPLLSRAGQENAFAGGALAGASDTKPQSVVTASRPSVGDVAFLLKAPRMSTSVGRPISPPWQAYGTTLRLAAPILRRDSLRAGVARTGLWPPLYEGETACRPCAL